MAGKAVAAFAFLSALSASVDAADIDLSVREEFRETLSLVNAGS